jgi:hypothetical protein
MSDGPMKAQGRVRKEANDEKSLDEECARQLAVTVGSKRRPQRGG